MAGSSLLTLLDDIATILDDVAVLTKVAAKKTAGVLGDDLALNAEQVSGVRADRELPVVWSVFKGSALNKLILVPAALLISAFIPWLITPLLMLGGLFLCYEGFEKVAHKLLHSAEEDKQHHKEMIEAVVAGPEQLVEFEQDKIRGAIRTDFILSAEIIVIALGTVAASPLVTQIGVLVTIAVLMTLGVYGLVAGIVKLDDLGLHLSQSASGLASAIGRGILRMAPWLMKTLSFAGTAAMFLVGGGILIHGIPPIEHWVKDFVAGVDSGVLAFVGPMLANAIVGIIAGGIVVAVVTLGGKLFGKKKAADPAAG